MISPKDNKAFEKYLTHLEHTKSQTTKHYRMVRFNITNGVKHIYTTKTVKPHVRERNYTDLSRGNYDVGFWLYCQSSAPKSLMTIIRMIIARYGYRDWIKEVAPYLESQQFPSAPDSTTSKAHPYYSPSTNSSTQKPVSTESSSSSITSKTSVSSNSTVNSSDKSSTPSSKSSSSSASFTVNKNTQGMVTDKW